MGTHDACRQEPIRSGRPRPVRSAILRALSLARFALLAATDRVATSVRLEHEVALLREELRIRDGRLERVPPRSKIGGRIHRALPRSKIAGRLHQSLALPRFLAAQRRR